MAREIAALYNMFFMQVSDGETYIVSPRNNATAELVGVHAIYDVEHCIAECDQRRYNYRYLSAELQWYLSRDPRVAGIERDALMWSRICQRACRCANSNYGYLIFQKQNRFGQTQWQFAHEALARDSATRQAIMYLGGTDYQYSNNPDFVCTTSLQFLLRNNEMFLCVAQRSCDIIFGLSYDAPFFALLLCEMARLFAVTPRHIYHSFNSLHVYERFQTLCNARWRTAHVSVNALKICDATGVRDDWCDNVQRCLQDMR